MKQKTAAKKTESAFVKYEGISFNRAWVASKTLKEFSEHEKHHNLTPAQYKEVWDICKGNEPKVEIEKPLTDK